MQANAAMHRFNSIYDINKQDYEWHVKNLPEDSQGIILLYQNSVQESLMLSEILGRLAKKHVTRKFMRSVATSCVENFAEKDVPCLLFYKGSKLVDRVVGKECK